MSLSSRLRSTTVPGFRPVAWAAVAFVAAGGGCGDRNGPSAAGTYPVKGRVLLGDGQPLNSGRIVLVADDAQRPQAYGEIKPDGTFTLTTSKPDDGAVPGQYKVRLEPAEENLEIPATAPRGHVNPRLLKPKIPAKYTREQSSGLVVTIKPEANELEPIRLK
jgi:hypothetical protein